MQRQTKSQRKAYFPSVSVAATRFLSTARGDVKKAIKMMDEAQAWRANYFAKGPITDESVKEDFKHGIIYFAGRNAKLLPTIVIRANRVPDAWYKGSDGAEKLLRILIFSVEYLVKYMCIPGQVESNCLVVDLNGLGASQVPFKELKTVYSTMSHFYPGRLSRIYICNLSTMLSMGMSAAKALLTDRQKQKLVYIKALSDFAADFAPHQLEEDLGGTRPIEKEFFPYPVAAGPYKPESKGGPDPKAVKNLHQVFKLSGKQGRLWDAKKSEKLNTFLEYSEDAVAIFQAAGLPVPEDAVDPPQDGNVNEDLELEEGEDDVALTDTAESATSPGFCKKCCLRVKALMCPGSSYDSVPPDSRDTERAGE